MRFEVWSSMLGFLNFEPQTSNHLYLFWWEYWKYYLLFIFLHLHLYRVCARICILSKANRNKYLKQPITITANRMMIVLLSVHAPAVPRQFFILKRIFNCRNQHYFTVLKYSILPNNRSILTKAIISGNLPNWVDQSFHWFDTISMSSNLLFVSFIF